MKSNPLTPKQADGILRAVAIPPEDLPLALSREELHRLAQKAYALGADHDVIRLHYKKEPQK